METLLQEVSCGGVTFSQFFPPSRVIWIRPSSVPAQRVPASLNDGATAYIVPRCFPFSGSPAEKAPRFAGISGDSRVRSGLMTCHARPPSVVLNKTFAAKYRVPGSNGEKTIGSERLYRYWPVRIGSGATFAYSLRA